MISCERAKELLSDFLENELAPDTRKLMEAHLKICPGCQVLGAQVKFITDKLHTIKSINTSDKFDQNLRSRIVNGSAQKGQSSPISFQKLSFGVSGVVVLAALYFFVFSEGSSGPTSPTLRATPGSESITNPTPQPGQAPVMVDQSADKDNPEAVNDSLKNIQQNIDQNQIKLIEQDKQ